MEVNPVNEWQRLQQHYRQMFDEELFSELADDLGNLTDTAQQALKSELASRKLDMRDAQAEASRNGGQPGSALSSSAAVHWEHPNHRYDRKPEEKEAEGPREFTWKTLLCECDTNDEAWQMAETLRKAGIDSWIEGAKSGAFAHGSAGPRVLVAADQLDEARRIASQPIPQEIVEESQLETPEYEPPVCPRCGAPDPALESVEPTNSWLCEGCEHQWTDPAEQ